MTITESLNVKHEDSMSENALGNRAFCVACPVA